MRARFAATAAFFALAFATAASAQDTRWVGAYNCDYSVTGMSLTLTPLPDNQLRAVFTFYAQPSNPGVPTGSFEMTGVQEERAIRLSGSRWINQPPGYAMVNLSGEISADGAVLTAALDTPEAPGVCTAAALVREQ